MATMGHVSHLSFPADKANRMRDQEIQLNKKRELCWSASCSEFPLGLPQFFLLVLDLLEVVVLRTFGFALSNYVKNK